MVIKLNPRVITDDMLYEGNVAPMDSSWAYPSEEINDVPQYTLIERVKEDKLWGEIRRAAKTNSTLQSALEECIIIYKLSKEYTNGT